MSRYEYLVMEKEMVADLTDSFRSCSLCSKWAASQESVRCEFVHTRRSVPVPLTLFPQHVQELLSYDLSEPSARS